MSSLLNIAAGNPATASFYDYQIENSLRNDSSANNSYLGFTPTTNGNRKTWTWSGWVKRTVLGTADIFGSGTSSSTQTSISFVSDDRLSFILETSNQNYQVVPSAKFRDVSSWYHIVAVCDTTDATGNDRMKIYVNGERLTELDVNSNPTLNFEGTVNSTSYSMYVSRQRSNSISSNLYFADVNLIDGQALDPTSFGETKSGVWIPKDTSDLTFGTNGFRLEFGDSAAIGDDTSGNGNDYTVNNLSAHDVVPDSPVNNYAVVNPLARADQDPRVTLSEGNLNIRGVTNSDSNFNARFATIPLPSSGKYYAECRAYVISNNGNSGSFGVVDPDAFDANEPSSKTLYNFADGEGFDGISINLYLNTIQAYADGVASGSQITGLTDTAYILKLALDIDNGKVFVGYNDVWLNSADPAAGTGEIATRTFTTSDVIAIQTVANVNSIITGNWLNFGQDSTFGGNVTAGGNSDANGYGDFAYAVPSGFLALNSANLPEPAISPMDDEVPEDYFNTVLYTGNGSTQSITGVNFQPDWVWVKSRNVNGNHILQDAVRGVGKGLFSDLSNAENASMGGMTSFDSDGFSLDGSVGELNANTRTFAAWNWKAGSTAVSNTDGSITSSVSANTEAGFSIVSYTGTGSAATIGHGLSQAPDMIIAKRRSGTDDWVCYHSALTSAKDKYMVLNKTNAEGTVSNFWGTSTPDSSVFGALGGYAHNKSGSDFIAYCFHSVEGYSKIGSYTGNNNSSNGTFVYTGFRPSFVLTKKSNGTSNWNIIDNHRPNENNPANNGLLANSNLSESGLGTSHPTDLLSNGFKFYNTEGGFNGSATYLYMAFAEMPQKYANAR